MFLLGFFACDVVKRVVYSYTGARYSIWTLTRPRENMKKIIIQHGLSSPSIIFLPAKEPIVLQ
jgi:hypothetical protein